MEEVVHPVVAHVVHGGGQQAREVLDGRHPGHVGGQEEVVHHHRDVRGVHRVVVGHVQVGLRAGKWTETAGK